MASLQILLVSILLIAYVQGQYEENGYEEGAFGGPDDDGEPSQDESVYSSEALNPNDYPRNPKFDVYPGDYDVGRGRSRRQGDETTLAPVINWRSAKERFKAFYKKLREKYRALRERARMLGNELNER